MTSVDWKKLLKDWSKAIIASGEYSDFLGKGAKINWAGFAPATEAAIAESERRLNLRLPKSYRTFLQASNGRWLDGVAGPTRLWAVEEIRPLAEVDPETVAIWSAADEQLDYTAAVQISDDQDGRYLIAPSKLSGDQEWQVFFFANWVPGPQCHDSFESLMRAKFDTFVAAHPPMPKVPLARRNLGKPSSRGNDRGVSQKRAQISSCIDDP